MRQAPLLLAVFLTLSHWGCAKQALESCQNGGDDDGDGFADCLDVDCIGLAICEPVCGNGVLELGESCDGAELGGLSCESFGTEGALSCDASCNLDTSGCGVLRCGDGVPVPGEICYDAFPSQHVGIFPTSAALGDLDGQGGDDLAVFSLVDNDIKIFFHREDGGFSFQGALQISVTTTRIFLLDIDGQNGLDIVSSHVSGFETFFNQGNGAFSPTPLSVTLPSSPPSHQEKIRFADIDGQNGPDLLLPEACDGECKIEVFLNQGDGSFSPTADAFIEGVFSPIGSSFTTADIDQDGSLDIIAMSLSKDLLLLRNQGQLEFSPTPLATFPEFFHEAVAADFNRDGATDIAVALLNREVFLLLALESGSFSAPVLIREAPAQIHLPSLYAGDVDGRNGPDLLVTGASLTKPVEIFLNQGDGAFAPSLSLHPGSDADVLALGELNGEAGDDFVVLREDFDSIGIFAAREDGALANPPRISLPPGGSNALMEDLDGENGPDIITLKTGGLGGTSHVLLRQQDGSFQETSVLSHGLGAFLLTGDFDGENGPDIVSIEEGQKVIRLFLHQGDGTFAEALQSSAQDIPSLLAAAGDFDNQSGLDLAVVLRQEGTESFFLRLFFQQGNGLFSPGPRLSLDQRPRGIAVGDLDGQGGLDVALTAGPPTLENGALQIFFNQGDGALLPPVALPVGFRPTGVVAADLDGLGELDLAVANSQSHDLSLYLNQGGGLFAPERRIPLSLTPEPGRAESLTTIKAADLDRQNGLDLVAHDFTGGGLFLFANEGDGSFAAPISLGLSEQGVGFFLEELNGDGVLDIAAPSGKTLTLLLSRP